MSGDGHTPINARPVATSFGTSACAHGIDAQPHDKPEVQVGAAFAGGLAAALILKRLLGRD